MAGLTGYRVARGRTLEQIPWTTYFERELSLKSEQEPEVVYHAYLTSPVGKGPLFVMHHGAGSSGLSFAVVASEIKKRLSTAGILAIDCRGHGSTNAPGDKALDMRLDTLSSDLLSMVQLTKNEMAWPEMPPIVLVGHSLGGAVVTDLAKSGRLGTSVLGYAVLDVVEGSAIDALQSMHTYLSTRPLGFATLQAGIEWHIRSRTIRNSISARTSVPALLVFNENDDPTRPWRWRTNLGATQPYWEGWFIGLSKKFLGAKGGKLLLLAGTDRLDTELTIGQMQGLLTVGLMLLSEHCVLIDRQGNMPCKCSPRPVTSFTKICRRRQPFRWSTSFAETTGVRSCFLPRFRIFSNRAKEYEKAQIDKV